MRVEMTVSTIYTNENGCFPNRKRLFPQVETIIPCSGNRYFHRFFLKTLQGKGLRRVFSPYNIIKIERKYYYNRLFCLSKKIERPGTNLISYLILVL